MTKEQRDVMAHVVLDPDAWYAHAVKTFGQSLADKHMTDKVAKWKPSYDAAVAKGDYKPRAEKEAEAQDAKIAAAASSQLA